MPAKIDIFSNVLVLNKNVRKGDIITATDLSLKRLNVAALHAGFIEEPHKAEGMQLKRALGTGEILRYRYLSKPNIVHKGQTVVLSAKSLLLSVETSGIALGDGYLGQNIQVRNRRSNRIVDAKVIAPGKVTIATR